MPGRDSVLGEIRTTAQWDVLVIGGGATGMGAAVEAASRGYRVLLIERDDFAKGTSSRSTKLAHGGVRYLPQLKIALVVDALRERGSMLRNAPHLVHRLPFVVPVYSYSGLPYYGLGLKIYDHLSGSLSLGRSEILSQKETIGRLPTLAQDGLRGGILYYDGQFDDARYVIALLRTLQDAGGSAINYMEAIRLLKRNGRTVGVRARDRESGEEIDLPAKVVLNATGVFTEEILRMDTPTAPAVLAVSQGTHFVLPRSWLPGDTAMMIPKTEDSRVLFAIPWRNRVVVGTTDEPVKTESAEPRSMAQERRFLEDHIRRYFGRQVSAQDVLSVWSGQRPLVRKGHTRTSRLSRDHKILVSASGLVTVTGGKWTTYRKMGEDAIDRAASVGRLKPAPSRTRDLRLHGWIPGSESTNQSATTEHDCDRTYGSDLPQLEALASHDPALNDLLHPRLPYRKRDVVWAARCEMARTVEDVLARRTRALFLDARASIEAAPEVGRLLANELARDAAWASKSIEAFRQIAAGYLYEDQER